MGALTVSRGVIEDGQVMSSAETALAITNKSVITIKRNNFFNDIKYVSTIAAIIVLNSDIG